MNDFAKTYTIVILILASPTYCLIQMAAYPGYWDVGMTGHDETRFFKIVIKVQPQGGIVSW